MKTLLVIVLVILLLSVAAFLSLGALLPANGTISRGAKDLFIDVKGSKIRYRTSDNKGPPMILLHGFGGSLSEWGPLVNAVKCGMTISLDLIGFGLSDKPSITYDLETQRQYILGFMDSLGIEKTVLVGSSMGSSIALWTAAHSPERIGGLVVFAPSALPGSMRHRWPGNLFYRPNIMNRTARWFVASGLFNAIFPTSLGCQAIDITSSYNEAFTESLFAIHQPLLIVWSRGDRRVPFSYSEHYRELLPHALFIEAPPQAGHSALAFPTTEIIRGVCEIVARAGIKDER